VVVCVRHHQDAHPGCRVVAQVVPGTPHGCQAVGAGLSGGHGDVSVAVVPDQVRECPEEAIFGHAAVNLASAADQIFRMFGSPHSSTPRDQDCRMMPMTIRPLEL
jgi:hypothetical protein